MKTGKPEKKKIVRLQIGETNGFALIGISSHENDYRLVWAMNNAFSFQFTRIENLVIFNQKLNTDLEFSRFIFTDEDKYLTYHLISNRCPDGFLFPEIKNLDYLLQITGELDSKHLALILKELKKVGIVSATFMIDPKQLKDVERKSESSGSTRSYSNHRLLLLIRCQDHLNILVAADLQNIHQVLDRQGSICTHHDGDIRKS